MLHIVTSLDRSRVRIYTDADSLRGVNIVDGDEVVTIQPTDAQVAQLEFSDRRKK